MNNELTTPLQKIIDSCENLIEMRKGSIIGHNTIIEMDGLYLNTTTKWNEELKGYEIIDHSMTADPSKASHFTPEDANNIADKFKNGNGTEGQAIIWKTACNEAIKRYSESIEFFMSFDKA